VFAVKRGKTGHVERLKSRLIVKGCAQRYSDNFTETFSPVARYSSIKLVIAVAVKSGLYMHQMELSSAYLNSDLHDTVYMRQPEGFIDDQYPKRVLELHKSLYGLKQSDREWNERLNAELLKIGKRGNIIVVYVDDLIIASSSKDELGQIKRLIAKEFIVWTAVNRSISWKLKSATDLKLHYEPTGVPIHCFVDADWAGDSGWVLITAGAVFTWASKKESKRWLLKVAQKRSMWPSRLRRGRLPMCES